MSGKYFIPAVFFLVISGLVFTGVSLIVKSDNIYSQSFEQSNIVTQRLIDSSFKKTVTAPVPIYAAVKDGYTQALFYFALAIAALLIVLLLPRLQTFNISPSGGISVTLKDVQQKIDNLITQTNTIQANSAGEGGKINTAGIQPGIKAEQIIAEKELHALDAQNDDPQKNKWGGLAERNSRRLSAIVETSNIDGYYKIKLTVETTDKNLPLTGLVKFHLHNTFINPNPVIAVQNGAAILILPKVYGAFTVGAETDDGQTRLELDLAELKDLPKGFTDN